MYEQQQSNLENEKVRRALYYKQQMENLKNPNTQMVSGRAVPYSPIQGLSQIAKALIYKNGLEESQARTATANATMDTERKSAVDAVMGTFNGRDEVYDQSAMTTPENEGAIQADPEKAAIMAAGDPYTKNISPVIASMMKAQNVGTGSRAKPVAAVGGYRMQDKDGNWVMMKDTDGKPVIPVTASPELTGDKAAQKEKRKLEEKLRLEAKLKAKIQEETNKQAMGDPNSPEYIKRKDAYSKDYEKLKAGKIKTDGTIQKIDRILDTSKSDAFNRNFGGYNAQVTQYAPDAQDMRLDIDSLKSDLKAAGLEMIRSGGQSIGMITEKEWPILEKMIDNISPMMSEEKARETFQNIKAKMEGMRNNSKDVFDTRWGDTQFINQPSSGKLDTKGEIDLSQPPEGWDAEDYKYLTDEEKRQAHGK